MINGPSYKLILPTALKNAMEEGLKGTSDERKTIEITDSVVYYNQKIKSWENILANNERRKAEAISQDLYRRAPDTSKAPEKYDFGNISFGSGVTIDRSQAFNDMEITGHGIDISHSVLFVHENFVEAFGTGAKLKGEAGYTGSEKFVWSSGTSSNHTVGFVLAETGTTDQITVDYTMDTHSSPATYMFRTRGGRTSCPFEPEVRTKYFEPGRHIINEGTMQIEVPKLALSGGQARLQVPAHRLASFTLDLTNESETSGEGWFRLSVKEATNPHGAVLAIDGLPIGNGRFFTVPAGEVLKKTLTVGRGPVEDNYEDITLVLSSDCDGNLFDEVKITVEYLPSCTEVAIVSPTGNWIMNNNTGDSVMVEIGEYDINYNQFGYIELLYRLTSSPQWSSEMKFYPNQERFENAQGQKTYIDGAPSIKYWWKKDGKPDGEYEFYARSVCETSGSTNTFIAETPTPPVAGTMDMTRPVSLGLPSPANGIMGIGDEISITFNENIQTGMLTRHNFSITGVLNAQTIAEPNVGVSFTGAAQKAQTEMPIFTGGAHFSIETWFKKDIGGGAGTLFTYGDGGNAVVIGFDAAGYIEMTVGDVENRYTLKSHDPITDDGTWKYFTVGYDPGFPLMSILVFETTGTTVHFGGVALDVPTQGRLTVGGGFKGVVARTHFYGVERKMADIASSMNLTKSGMERGLTGYWAMDEAEGGKVEDKARSRHLTLSGGASWYIYPSGHAIRTSNTHGHVAIPTSTYPLNAYSDFTLEFWYRSDKDFDHAVLFYSDRAYIGLNYGSLTLNVYDNEDIPYATTETKLAPAINLYNDKNWHHVAMSVRRGGSVNVFVDGVTTATFPESQLGDMSSGYYIFGTWYRNNTAWQPFDGYFDEIRLWNSALTRDGINLNRNTKLRGDEPGLLAYYPFEKYERQPSGPVYVDTTLKNMTDLTVAATAAATQFTDAAVSVKDVRPVVDVPFDFVSSSNKIVLTIDPTYFALVEGAVLDVAVEDVYDMRGNRSNTERWTAFVRRNALRWETDPVYIAMEEGAARSFTARVSNTGGATISYSVENLPPWLTVTNSVGTLQPMANRDLTFTVTPGTNIGNYEASVVLTSGNGVSEILPVQLKISGQRPDWEVDPNAFDGSMSVIGQIKINGVFSENTEDILAAFIGEECVGLASLTRISQNNAYFVFASIYGNATHDNRPVTFRLWSAATGRVYPVVNTSIADIRFAASGVMGTPNDPVIFDAADVYEQNIALRRGWNWISSNVENTSPSIFNQMKLSIGSAGVQIKGQVGHASYIAPNVWEGDGKLTSVSSESMYLVNVSRDMTLSLHGKPAYHSLNLTIKNGWNYIGYIPQVSMPVQDALAGLNAEQGDIIKGQSAYAVYMGGSTGWIGTLTFMRAGAGYMYLSNGESDKWFWYPSTLNAPPGEFLAAAPPQSNWSSVNPAEFASSMTVMSFVMRGGSELRGDQIELAAFSGENIRGSTFLKYVQDLDKYVGFLMIYGESGNQITLKVYDHETDTEYDVLNDPLVFAADAMHGTPDALYVVDVFDETAPVTFNVTYSGNGNTDGTVPTMQSGSPDTKIVLSGADALVRSGHEFAGWNTAADGSGTDYAVGDEFTIPSANTVLFAQWTPVQSIYAVTLVGIGNRGTGAGNYSVGAEVTVSAGVTPDGMRFVGWTTENSGVTFANAAAGKTTFIMPSNDVSITAEFEEYAAPERFEVAAGPNPVLLSAGSVNFYTTVSSFSSATFIIYNATGNIVRKLTLRDGTVATGDPMGSWDLKNARGVPVTAGTYLVRGTVKLPDGKVEAVSFILGVK